MDSDGHNIPVCAWYSCAYEELSCNSKVFNVDTLPDVVWIRIPDGCNLDAVTSISELDSTHSVEYTRDACKPWIQVSAKLLDADVGHHVYSILMHHTELYESIDLSVNYMLYFSYIIQNDNPDKPYIYMDRTSE